MTAKQLLRKQLAAIAVSNGWHVGNHNTVSPAFNAWWRSVTHLSPRLIRREFGASVFNEINPQVYNHPNVLKTFLREHQDSLAPILARYRCDGISYTSEINKKLKCLYDEMVAAVSNTHACEAIISRIKLSTLS